MPSEYPRTKKDKKSTNMTKSTHTSKNKNQSPSIIDELKKHDKFVLIDRKFPVHLPSDRTVNDTRHLWSGDVSCNTSNETSMILLGILRVSDGIESQAYNIKVYIYDDNDTLPKKSVMMQILDMPRELWITIDTVENLNRFINCYININAPHKTDRYYLMLKNISPIAIERIMLINRYLNQNLYGPTVDANDMSGISNCNSSVNLGYMYTNTLQQYDGEFELTSFTRLTGSTIGIKMTSCGIFVHIIYPECGFFKDIIQHYNKRYITGIADNVPLDVLLFLIQLSPINLTQTVNIIKSSNLINSINIDTIWMLANGHSSNNEIADVIVSDNLQSSKTDMRMQKQKNDRLSNMLKILISLYNRTEELINTSLINEPSKLIINSEIESNSDIGTCETKVSDDVMTSDGSMIEDNITDHMILSDTKQYIRQKISIIVANQIVNRILTDDHQQTTHEYIFMELYTALHKEDTFKYVDETYTKFILSKMLGEWIRYMNESNNWDKSTKDCTKKK